MKKLACLFLLLSCVSASAQVTQSQVQTNINQYIKTNGQGAITGPILNNVLTTMNGAIFQPFNYSNTWIQPQTFSKVVINPTPGTLNNGLDITQGISGSTTTYVPLNQILIVNDTASATTAGGEIVGLNIPYLFGGGDQGARTTLALEARRTGASSPANVLYQDTGLSVSFNGESNNNGTSGTKKGLGFGGYFSSQLFNNATYWATLAGLEVDIGVATGSSADYVIGQRISHVPTHAVAGLSYDTALDFVDATGTSVGWDALITSSNVGGQYPLASTGTFIRTLGSQTFANGIDMSSATISGYFLKGTSFSVSGAGAVVGASYSVGATPAAGVSCSGNVSPTTMVIINGIVTHC